MMILYDSSSTSIHELMCFQWSPRGALFGVSVVIEWVFWDLVCVLFVFNWNILGCCNHLLSIYIMGIGALQLFIKGGILFFLVVGSLMV